MYPAVLLLLNFRCVALLYCGNSVRQFRELTSSRDIASGNFQIIVGQRRTEIILFIFSKHKKEVLLKVLQHYHFQ
jgi:hypothetical protein